VPDRTDRLLRAYYLYQATANGIFFWPIFFLYYQERVGLTVATILWLQSYAVAVRALLDLPFGAVADRYSRRACLQAGALCQVVGAGALLLWPTLAVAFVAESLFATASAMKSGADSAFLFDALDRAGRVDLYPRAESRGQAIVSLASGATGIVGGLLAAGDLRWPYVATVLAAATSGAIASRLGDEARTGRAGATARGLVVAAGRHAARSPGVRWVIALAAFTVVSSHVYFYLQQPYLRAIGVPVAVFGVVFAGTKALTALVAIFAYRIDALVGLFGATTVMALAPALGLGAMSAVAGPYGAVLVLSRGVLDGLWQPLVNVYMNRLVESRLRATMLSLQSLVARLALALAVSLIGIGTQRSGVAPTLGFVALGVAVVGAALVATAPRALVAVRACRAGRL